MAAGIDWARTKAIAVRRRHPVTATRLLALMGIELGIAALWGLLWLMGGHG